MRRATAIFTNFIRVGATAAAITLAAPHMILAQDLFQPVVQVNDGVITEFEVVQRVRLMEALRQPGNNRGEAIELLIEDRLKLAAAARAGIEPGLDEVQLGVEDFAARANLTGEELIAALGQMGVAPETLQDYVRATLAWGELVRTRFASRARPGEAEIDRALALGTGRGSARVLLSEIVLPLTPDLAPQTEQRAAAISDITTTAAFDDAARRFSASPSRANAGRLDWVRLSELPPQLAPVFLTMQPGEVTEPVPIEGGIVIFQFRGIEDIRPPLATEASLDFMRMWFPAGTDLNREKADLAARVDSCGDLYGVYFGASEDQLTRETAQSSALPADVSRAMTVLDPGEIGVVGPRTSADGGSLVMLCARNVEREESLSREEAAQSLFVRRLNSYAESYLAELRADAYVESL